MKTTKLKETFGNARGEINHALRLVCGKPSPVKRFVIVLVIGVSLSVAYTYSLVSSIYNIGKNEAKKELMELQHIKQLELKHSNDSIKSIKNEELKNKNYEYEQSDR